MGSEKSFKNEFISGAFYTSVAKYANIVVSIAVSSVLARLLLPREFATISIATIIIGFFGLLTTSGLGPAIIQDKGLSKQDLSHIYSFTVYLSAIAAFIFLALSPIIGFIYSDPQLQTISMWLSLNLFFSLINTIPNALLFKDKKFKYIAIRTIIVQVILGIISVIAAFYGAGIYALMINPIVGSFLIYLINYKYYPIPFTLRIKFAPIKRIIPYSAYQIGFNILNYFYRTFDKLLIGHYMNFTTLGYYEKSYRLMMMPLDNIGSVITPVMHPLLSEHKDNLKFIYDKYLRIICNFAIVHDIFLNL